MTSSISRPVTGPGLDPVHAAAGPRRVRWPVLVGVFALTSSIGYIAMIQVLPLVLAPMAADLGVSRTAAAGTSTVCTLAGAVVAFPAGRLIDRYGARWLMTGGTVVGTAGMLLWASADSLAPLYAAFVLIGACVAITTYETAFAVLVVATEHHVRDKAILLVTMIAGLATYLVYPLLGQLVEMLGWRQAIVWLAITLAVTSVPTHALAVPSSAFHRQRARRRPGVSVGAAVRQGRFWLLVVSFTAQAASFSAFGLLLVTYLRDIGHSASTASAIPITIGVMQIGSRLILVTVLRNLDTTRATTIAFAIQACGMLLLPLAGPDVVLTVACVACVGIGQGIGVIARPTILATTFGAAQFASIQAVLIVPTALARAGSPVAAAAVSDWRFLVAGGVASALAAAALVPLWRRRREG